MVFIAVHELSHKEVKYDAQESYGLQKGQLIIDHSYQGQIKKR